MDVEFGVDVFDVHPDRFDTQVQLHELALAATGGLETLLFVAASKPVDIHPILSMFRSTLVLCTIFVFSRHTCG